MTRNPEYWLGGTSFVAILGFAGRYFLKLVNSGEAIYERRSASQVEEIARLETSIGIMRREMEACHAERVKLADKVGTLENKVRDLENKL